MTRTTRLLIAATLLAGCTASETTTSGAVPGDEAALESSASDPAAPATATTPDASPDEPMAESASDDLQLATFGAGCYWCVEAVYDQIDGVRAVRSGFMGGHVDDPSYKAVCSGTTGHAEVCQLEFDPSVVSFETLLEWFWRLHDPTTLNRQGADVGTQYRSAVFYHSDEQREQAEASRSAAQSAFADPIVTEITAASRFYAAPDDHDDYYVRNKNAGYCRVVIKPKLEKLKLDS